MWYVWTEFFTQQAVWHCQWLTNLAVCITPRVRTISCDDTIHGKTCLPQQKPQNTQHQVTCHKQQCVKWIEMRFKHWPVAFSSRLYFCLEDDAIKSLFLILAARAAGVYKKLFHWRLVSSRTSLSNVSCKRHWLLSKTRRFKVVYLVRYKWYKLTCQSVDHLSSLGISTGCYLRAATLYDALRPRSMESKLICQQNWRQYDLSFAERLKPSQHWTSENVWESSPHFQWCSCTLLSRQHSSAAAVCCTSTPESPQQPVAARSTTALRSLQVVLTLLWSRKVFAELCLTPSGRKWSKQNTRKQREITVWRVKCLASF